VASRFSEKIMLYSRRKLQRNRFNPKRLRSGGGIRRHKGDQNSRLLKTRSAAWASCAV